MCKSESIKGHAKAFTAGLLGVLQHHWRTYVADKSGIRDDEEIPMAIMRFGRKTTAEEILKVHLR